MPEPTSPWPLTLPGVCAYGVEGWLRDFRPALPPAEYQAGYERLFGAYARALPAATAAPELHDVGVIEFKLPLRLARWWFEVRRRRALARAGVELVCDRHGILAPALAAEQWREREQPLAETAPQGWRRAGRERLLMLRLNWRRHALSACCPGRHGRAGYVLGDARQREPAAYIREHGLDPISLRPVGCLGAAPEPRAEDLAQAADFAQRFWAELAPERLADGDVFDDRLRAGCVRRLAATLAWVRQGRARLRRWRDGELLLTSVVSRPSRVFAAVWKSLGRQVTGFTHGNNYLVWSPSGMTNNGTHRVCDRFVVSSAGEQLLVEHARRTCATPLTSAAVVERAELPVFRDLFQNLQARPPVRAIRTVMVVGFSMDYQFYPCLPSYDTLTYAHLTLRLLQALRDAGFRVIYKDHPDTCAEAAALFRDRADETLTDDFTGVLDRADCLFYVAPFSTTLGYGLLSRVPAVILDNRAWNLWHPEQLPLLKRRAAFFPVAPDPDGVLQFDASTLKDTVQSSLELTDPALVERWAM